MNCHLKSVAQLSTLYLNVENDTVYTCRSPRHFHNEHEHKAVLTKANRQMYTQFKRSQTA
jgi:hypothetical protein